MLTVDAVCWCSNFVRNFACNPIHLLTRLQSFILSHVGIRNLEFANRAFYCIHLFVSRLNSRLRLRQKNFFKARTAYRTVFLNFKVPFYRTRQRLNSRLRRMRQKNFFKARTAYCTVFLNFKVPFYRMRLYHRMTSAENENTIQYPLIYNFYILTTEDALWWGTRKYSHPFLSKHLLCR